MLSRRACSGWKRFVLCLPVIFFFVHMLPATVCTISTQREAKKFDHLVLGPASGEGLPDHLQCQGTKALNKTSIRTFSNDSHSEDLVVFVTVFATYNSTVDWRVNGRPVDLVTIGDTSYNKVERSMAILNVFTNFIQVTMPQSDIIIITDPASELPVHRNKVLHRLSRDKAQGAISEAEIRLKEQYQRQGQVRHYIFTDSDIAVVNDLGQIFDHCPNFDMAITFRNNKEQPLNSGFIAVRGTAKGILRAKVLLQEVLKVYSSKFMKASRMLGDQLALFWVVKSQPSFDVRRFTRREAFIDEIGGASVLFLPFSSYNWTPPEGAGQFHGMPLDVKVVHFKGSRKQLMLESWNFLNSSPSSDISEMLCLILKSGRTKYDF
ncbi:unnamed protein product [Fraxinus pennsylvanica]|uniref:Nucleotide-diphospho-sugar transferase n=1 Tax=Fraxinus pennsylvanica TaxID=56036 RepID=A0AAD2AAG9_9LAMI|nr:unnamed protein product [Fraxinus pennsylvanica]